MEWKDLLLILVGSVTGFINTVAGGGTVIIMPFLIMYMGLPASVANGTNRIGVFTQTIFSAWGFKSKGLSPFVLGVKKSILLGLTAGLGAFIGSKIAIEIPEPLYNRILSIVMVLVLILTLWKPKAPQAFLENKQKGYVLALIALFFVGMYAGFIQAGTGLFLILSLSYFCNLSLVQSNAIKTLIVFIFSIGTIAVFAYHNKIDYYYGVLLGIGNGLGGWIASRWSVKKDDRFIQVFMVITVCLMAVKLWYFDSHI